MEKANTEHNIRLTAAEIAHLWSAYMGDSMARPIFLYYLQVVEDQEVKPLIEHALKLTEEHLSYLSELFRQEGLPVPHGFTEEDVNLQAPRLYSDSFFLVYLRNTAKQGLALYAVTLAVCARSDVRDYFTECLSSTAKLFNKVADVLLAKGLFIRPPYIPYPECVEYVHKESFLNGVFGDKRPLNALEISHLYANIQTNALGKALIIGFAQTAKSQEVRQFFLRGKGIAQKQVEVFSSYLRDEDLPAPMTWDSEVLDSTVAPFSDKLMVFHMSGLVAAGLINYGAAISTSMRRDLTADYARLSAEIATYADDAAELMIKNGWLEKMPGNVDRRVLAEKH